MKKQRDKPSQANPNNLGQNKPSQANIDANV
jgi:hypothetical protein